VRARLRLKPGKERSLLRGHPWIFSGAIAKEEGSLTPGATVEVVSDSGQFLAQAAFSPESQIRARLWTVERELPIDSHFFLGRIVRAVELRRELGGARGAVRLVHSEADGLPGLIVDRYADLLVVQFLSQGVEHHRASILAALAQATGVARLYERSDADVRTLEGLLPITGALAGAPPEGPIEIEEHGLRYGVDVIHGQKTGFFIDQRTNRNRVAQLAFGDVLNCFCYTGGFSLAALRAGARSVTSIDSSADALALAEANVARNGFSGEHTSWLGEDVFLALRRFRDQGRQFDVVILDPPKFAPTASHVEKAARAYKDINLLGLKLLRPGGLLFTYSCSGGISPDLFQKIVAGAAQDAHVAAHVLERHGAASDHPVLLSFPEGDYLKGLVLRRLASGS